MDIKTKIKNVVRGLKQQWGQFGTKARLWDSEFAGGRWDHCEQTPGDFVYDYIEKYCMNGRILDLGCGSGNTGTELRAHRYAHYLGVDISEVAIQKAAARTLQNGRADKNQYLTGDIVLFVPQQQYDVIMFRESIYYVPHLKLRSLLMRYSQFLTHDGVFLVTVSNQATRKYKRIYRLIELNFAVLEKYSPSDSDDLVVVFKCRSSRANG